MSEIEVSSVDVVVVRHKEFLVPKYYRDTYDFEIIDPAGLSIRVFTRWISTGITLVRVRPSNFAKRFRPVGPSDSKELTLPCKPDQSNNPYRSPGT